MRLVSFEGKLLYFGERKWNEYVYVLAVMRVVRDGYECLHSVHVRSELQGNIR